MIKYQLPAHVFSKLVKKEYKVLFIDLDDTLIHNVSGNKFPKGIWDMKIDLSVLDTIKANDFQYVCIVTNQGGIEKGIVTYNSFKAKIDYVAACIREYLDYRCTVIANFCTSLDNSNPYRKPNIGLLTKALETIRINEGSSEDPSKDVMLMVGDASGKKGDFSDSDQVTAINMGIDYVDVKDFRNISEEIPMF